MTRRVTPRRRSSGAGGLAAVLSAVVLSACGLGTAGGFVPTGELAGELAGIDLDGATVAVGSKNFSEQILVGKMAVILLRSAGADAADFTSIPGSTSTRQAQVGDDLQFTWEYTGTAWIVYLGESDPIPDERAQWEAVRDADAELGLVWLPPAPMNNTYGFAMTRQSSERLGITKLSEIADIPIEERTFCVEAEFNARNDGLNPMLDMYDIPRGSEVPEDNIQLYDIGAIYAATAADRCTFGEVFTTDGRILALDLVVLEDDRGFFPKYNLSPVVNEHVLEEFPQVADLFNPVAERLSDETLIELNASIDVDGREPSEVAYEWLLDEGFIADPD